ncbi:MAG: transposase [Candidatus Thiodiazotropha sp. (ex. Lucinisca nassula)]|nr:transposase [Candidatus Thiodiazotropha sp. (ex. Lucinisca nassula)]
MHFHLLFLDGVYTTTTWGKSRFHRTSAPKQQELTSLVYTIRYRVAGFLEREGILERDMENSHLNLEAGDEDPMQQVLGCSVSYRVAVGPQQGRKVFRLQAIPSWGKDERLFSSILYKQPPCCDRCSWPRIDSCRRSSSNASNL